MRACKLTVAIAAFLISRMFVHIVALTYLGNCGFIEYVNKYRLHCSKIYRGYNYYLTVAVVVAAESECCVVQWALDGISPSRTNRKNKYENSRRC